VQSTGAISGLPLTDTNNWPIAVEGRPEVPVAQAPNVVGAIALGDYFRTMRIPLRSGRLFTDADGPESTRVALVSDSMAKRFWPGQDPVGQRVKVLFQETPVEVVGVVGDVRQYGPQNDAPVPEMYLPFRQLSYNELDVVVRTAIAGTAGAAVAVLRELDPDQPVLQLVTMEQRLASALSHQRLSMLLLGAFAALALTLAAIGIYSVLSYQVRRRRREIGIRVALGARVGDVLRLVVGEGMRPALIGGAVGLAASLALGRLLSSLVYGISASDPATYAAVAALLGLVALAACLVPAMQAARIGPARALREE
jgi:putative ABC transport system permease protein